MTDDLIDIIVPVWNRPVETRACLVSLMEHTPNGRILLVDNGSDRETERMLEEFAEALDLRMLLLKNRINEGFVKALNRGLTRSESRNIVVMRSSSRATANWLEPLLAFAAGKTEAGIVVPGFSDNSGRKSGGEKSGLYSGMELASGDFTAMLLSRTLLDSIGSFSEEMDGASWCLKDYSQRANRNGFRTSSVPDSLVERGEEICFGSVSRRADHEQRVRSAYAEAWGEERLFCLHLPKGSNMEEFSEKFPVILDCARHGHLIVLLAHATLLKNLALAGYGRAHSNITIQPISRLMSDRSARNAVSALGRFQLPLTLLDWESEIQFPAGGESHPFAELEKFVSYSEIRHYGRLATLN